MTGHRHATDRVDGNIIAECPNKEVDIDDHFAAQIEYSDAVDNDVYETFESILPDECRACGAAIDILGQEESSEVLTDGGAPVESAGQYPYNERAAPIPANGSSRWNSVRVHVEWEQEGGRLPIAMRPAVLRSGKASDTPPNYTGGDSDV